jgi:hypothetical protein
MKQIDQLIKLIRIKNKKDIIEATERDLANSQVFTAIETFILYHLDSAFNILKKYIEALLPFVWVN